MSDYSELTRLAQRVIDLEAADGDEPISEAWDEFEAVATPSIVLALIAEIEQDEMHLRAFRSVAETAIAERDHLKAENAGLKTGYEAYEQTVKELRGEVEALRKDAERYRWIRVKQTFIWLIQDWFPKDNVLTDVDAEIDAAMGKGEQS